MLIQPNTNIIILRNCPLDKSYEHTLYFENEASQISYFKSLRKHNLTKQSYQRFERGVLHVQLTAESLYDCNYLMFQNESFGSKWFYAFITSVEYVNNVSTKIKYEIDVMQTWFFDYTLKQCLVERQHTESDNIGEHLLPEGLELGEYVFSTISDPQLPFKGGEYDVVIAEGTAKLITTDTSTDIKYTDCVVSNVFCGVDFKRYSNPADAYARLKELNDNGKSNEVVAVFQIPASFWGTGSQTNFSQDGLIEVVGQNLSNPFNTAFKNDPSNDDEIGYYPRNKKLYTAPFFGLIGTSSSGDTKEYAYEYFTDPANARFGLSYSASASPIASLVPLDYKGIANNINEELICKDFPQCAYATDSFREYIALNAGSMVANTVTSITRASRIRNTDQATTQIEKAIGLIGSMRDLSVMPDKQHGNSLSYINYTRNKVGFILYQYKIRKEYAKIIDNFFQMYGYAINTVKTPNIHARQKWTYVKTVGCKAIGTAPASTLEKICNIFDNGITFWVEPNNVGNYDRANPTLV